MEASNCCGAKPVYELDENMGYCSECGRGAVFQEEQDEEQQILLFTWIYDCNAVRNCFCWLHSTT